MHNMAEMKQIFQCKTLHISPWTNFLFFFFFKLNSEKPLLCCAQLAAGTDTDKMVTPLTKQRYKWFGAPS